MPSNQKLASNNKSLSIWANLINGGGMMKPFFLHWKSIFNQNSFFDLASPKIRSHSSFISSLDAERNMRKRSNEMETLLKQVRKCWNISRNVESHLRMNGTEHAQSQHETTTTSNENCVSLCLLRPTDFNRHWVQLAIDRNLYWTKRNAEIFEFNQHKCKLADDSNHIRCN